MPIFEDLSQLIADAQTELDNFRDAVDGLRDEDGNIRNIETLVEETVVAVLNEAGIQISPEATQSPEGDSSIPKVSGIASKANQETPIQAIHDEFSRLQKKFSDMTETNHLQGKSFKLEIERIQSILRYLEQRLNQMEVKQATDDLHRPASFTK